MSWRTKPEAVDERAVSAVYEADVVVVGMGYAGTAAARAALEAGASVIGVELQPRGRFNSFGRDVGHINSAFLRSRGVPAVDPVDLFNEWMKRAGNRANPQLVMKFCRGSGEAFDWYTDLYTPEELKDIHVAFWPEGRERHREATENGDPSINGYNFWVGTAEFPDPMGWPGKPTLQDCVQANLARIEELGGRLLFGFGAEQPVMDGERMAGILAASKSGEIIRCMAKKGVILAAGDFAGNREMLEELCCDIPDLMPAGAKLPPSFGRRGRGQQIGLWAGGKLESRPLPTMGGNSLMFMGPCTFGALYLDGEGKRYCNEIFGGTELSGFAGNQSPRDEFYIVFDEHWVENEMQWAYPGHGGFDANIPGNVENARKVIADGLACGGGCVQSVSQPPMNKTVEVFCGRTPEELVKNAGLEEKTAQNVVASIRRYNELCRAGRDEDFGRDPRILDPLTDMLFLQKAQPVMFGQMLVTVGGLVTDENQQVLGEGYRRIEGLYASGNCCGRRFGSQYATPIAGVSIGMAITLGREVGRFVAEK